MPRIHDVVLMPVLLFVSLTFGLTRAHAQAMDYYQTGTTNQGSLSGMAVENSIQSFDGQLTNALTLEALQGTALATNPTLVQARSQVEAAQAAAYQAGLRPNPTVGYEGQFDRNGAAPNETWGGGFVSQEIVTAGKLRLSRAKWCQRAKIAQTNLQAQQQRVQNDVAIQFYRTLAAQRSVEISHQLVANANDNLQTHREMLNVGQTNQPGLLRAEIDLQREQLNLRQAEQELQHAWRLLQSIVNSPNLTMSSLVGSLEPGQAPLDWETAWSELLSASPELIAAQQKIKHDHITVARERVEPIPNITASVTSIKNFDADLGQTTFNIGMPFPVFDRNRGTIRQAQADLAQSHAEITRLELELRNRLATQFRDYQMAWQKVREFESSMLPKAQQAFDLLHESYKARRAAWPDVLAAQRMSLMLEAEQIKNLAMYRENDVAIRGLLLTGGLMVPQPPVGGGHIDAVAQPR